MPTRRTVVHHVPLTLQMQKRRHPGLARLPAVVVEDRVLLQTSVADLNFLTQQKRRG